MKKAAGYRIKRTWQLHVQIPTASGLRSLRATRRDDGGAGRRIWRRYRERLLHRCLPYRSCRRCSAGPLRLLRQQAGLQSCLPSLQKPCTSARRRRAQWPRAGLSGPGHPRGPASRWQHLLLPCRVLPLPHRVSAWQTRSWWQPSRSGLYPSQVRFQMRTPLREPAPLS